MAEQPMLDRFGNAEHCQKLLTRSRRELLNLLNTLPYEQLHQRSAAEVWSPAEVMEHLAKTEDSFARVIRRLRRLANGENLPAVVVAAVQLSPTGKLVAPEYLVPSGQLDNTQLEDTLSQVRAFLFKEVSESGELINHPVSFAHVYFGELNGLSWLQCAVYHERHHLEQIRQRLG